MSWFGKSKPKIESEDSLSKDSLAKALKSLEMTKAQEKAYNTAMKTAMSSATPVHPGTWATTSTPPSGLSGLATYITSTTTGGEYFTLDYLINFQLVKSTCTGELYLYNHGDYYTITGMQLEVVEHCEFVCTLGQLLSTVNDKAKK